MDLSEGRSLIVPACTLADPPPQSVIALDPFGRDRRTEHAVLLPRETLQEYFDRIGLQLQGRPIAVRVNGARVPRHMWSRTRPRAGQLIEVQALVEGSGSGRKAWRAVLQVVVAIAWAFAGPWGIFVLAAGNFLINKWLPPHTKNPLRNRRSGDTSPSYSITGLQNRARLYEALPVVLGTHRIVPDYAALPYTEFEGEDQYLYALFHFGIDGPALTISDIKLGDTPITNFTDVTLEWGDPTNFGRNYLVKGNVDTVAGGALEPLVTVTRTGSADTVTLGIDIEGFLFATNSDGVFTTDCGIEAEYRLAGTADPWSPFFASGFTTATSYWSRGYDAAGAPGGWVQVEFDNNLSPTAHVEGAAAGFTGGPRGTLQACIWRYKTVANAASFGWQRPQNLTTVTSNTNRTIIFHGSTKPLRRTFYRAVAPGQYEVRVMRYYAASSDPNVTASLSWNALKSYQRDTGNYNGQRRLAVKIRASGQLSGTLDNLNAIATRSVWTKTGGVDLLEPSSNPAWLFACVAEGIYQQGRLVFGLGLSPTTQIDYASLEAWAAWCDARGLTFNAVIDSDVSNGELLDLICAAGRASKTWVTGKLGVVYDAEALPITGVVSMGNIKAGTFRVQYVTETPPDEIVATFLNAANGYAQEEVRKLLPGVTTPRKVERTELFGVTDRAQAGKWVNLRVASLLYRRKLIEWEQDAEGTIARRGDVVALSHDMTQWGYSGRVVSVTGVHPNVVFTLDRRVPANLTTPNDEWIGVRVPGETGYRVLRVQCVPAGADNDNDQVTLVDTWPGGVDLPGVSRPAVDYLWVYDFKATPGYRVKILETVPRAKSNGRIDVQFRGVPDLAEYYAAESGTYTTVAPSTLLNGTAVVSGLIITEELKLDGNIFYVELTATWAANDRYASAEVLAGANGQAQVSIGRAEVGRRRFTWRASLTEVTWTVAVRPFNALGQPGTAISTTYAVLGTAVPPPPPDTFTVLRQPDGTREFRWEWTATDKPVDLEGVLIRYSSNTSALWDALLPFVTDDGFFTASPVESNQLLAGTYVFEIRSRDLFGNVSTTGRRITATLEDPRLGSVLDSYDVRAAGFPGTKTNCFVAYSTGWLEATATDTWATLPSTWAAWTRWAQTPNSPITYEHTTIDVGAVVVMRPIVQVDALGTVTITESHSTDGISYTSFTAIGSGFSARYVRVRVQVAATGGDPVPTIKNLNISIDAPIKQEDVNDFSPAALTGSYRIGVGDIRVPITTAFTTIRAVYPAVQGSSGQWTMTVVDKNTSPGPRVQFRNAGTLADPALADVFVRGF